MSRKSRRAAAAQENSPPSRRRQALDASGARRQAINDEASAAAERIENLPAVLERKQVLVGLIHEWAESIGLEIVRLKTHWSVNHTRFGTICTASVRARGGDIDEQFSAYLFHDDITGNDSVSVFLASDESRPFGDAQGSADPIKDDADLGAALQRADLGRHYWNY